MAHVLYTYKLTTYTILGHSRSLADSVYTINCEGRLQQTSASAHEVRDKTPIDPVSAEMSGEDTPAEKKMPTSAVTVAALLPAPPENDDEARIRKGDLSLYAYYLGAVKWYLLIICLCLIGSSSLADRGAGMCIYNPCVMIYLLTAVKWSTYACSWIKPQPRALILVATLLWRLPSRSSLPYPGSKTAPCQADR